MALRAAGDAARGATAVVSLEPCNHTGRTGPCTEALIAAGVARVVFAQADPNPVAAGGAQRLRGAGLEVVDGLLAEEASALNEAWTVAITRGRPMVTWKVATTLDGRVAAADGTSRWITGQPARAQVHDLRAQVDAVIVGTGTALMDNPSLTVRDESGHPVRRQPIRVVMGRRELPPDAVLRDGRAPLRHFRDQSPGEVLGALAAHGVQHVLLEGGPTLAASFVRAGLVDRIVWYLAPSLLGAGPTGLVDVGVTTIADARRVTITGISRVGLDVRVDATMDSAQP
jgi:diaminohydroxyphosphoribosylaminopyrimidine deaminase/5-amino-6-(5-phosphoribosylamino)uracil reductase